MVLPESTHRWFEGDLEVFSSPWNPDVHVYIFATSRRVRVDIDGMTIAESNRPYMLFETGLPTRYYMPRFSVRMDLLQRTDTVTQCPYKGTAEYWSVGTGAAVHRDIAWSYRAPLPECEKIAGLVAFHNEQADIYLDGVQQERPQ